MTKRTRPGPQGNMRSWYYAVMTLKLSVCDIHTVLQTHDELRLKFNRKKQNNLYIFCIKTAKMIRKWKLKITKCIDSCMRVQQKQKQINKTVIKGTVQQRHHESEFETLHVFLPHRLICDVFFQTKRKENVQNTLRCLL